MRRGQSATAAKPVCHVVMVRTKFCQKVPNTLEMLGIYSTKMPVGDLFALDPTPAAH
jgi:hypothetical protein